MKLLFLALLLAATSAQAITLLDYAKAHPLSTWVVKKGATMPNPTDQTNTLQEAGAAGQARHRKAAGLKAAGEDRRQEAR